MRIDRRTLLRGGLGIAVSLVAVYVLLSSVDLARTVEVLGGASLAWIALMLLTTVENVAFELRLSEYHTGLRAYSRGLLETIPYQLNSNDFVFDQELIAQVVAAGMGRRIGEIAVPTRYFEEASSVGFRRSVVYGLSTLRVVVRYLLHRLRLRRSPKLTARRP